MWRSAVAPVVGGIASVAVSIASAAVAAEGNASETQHTSIPLHLQYLHKQLRDLHVDASRAPAGPPYGYPTLSNVRHCETFTLAVDGAHKSPAWVYEQLEAGRQANPDRASPHRKRSYFHLDGTMPPFVQVQPTAYYGSGLDRGHMAPAADHKHSQRAMDATFRMSNISPQVGDGFNRHYWARLEQYCRSLRDRGDTVHVFSGPAFLPVRGGANDTAMGEVQGALAPAGMRDAEGRWWSMYPWVGSFDSGLVGVPTHFFKVILVEHRSGGGTATKGELMAVLLPNARIEPNTPLERFLVPLSTLQRLVGFPFFPALLDDHDVVEADAVLLARHAPQDHPLLTSGKEASVPADEVPAPVVELRGHAYALSHLCDSDDGCSLPAANWWKKRRSKQKAVAAAASKAQR